MQDLTPKRVRLAPNWANPPGLFKIRFAIKKVTNILSLKSPGFYEFCSNLTHFNAKSDISDTAHGTMQGWQIRLSPVWQKIANIGIIKPINYY